MTERDLVLHALGPIGATVDGRSVDIGGPRQRRLLAALILGAGRVVSRDRLIEAVWGDGPPAEAERTFRTYVARLRKALPDDVVVTEAPGYRLAVGSDQIDTHAFETLVERARRTVPTDPNGAHDAAQAAIDLWRGQAFAEVADEDWARPEVARLQELRVVAEELRADALIESGEPAAAVPLLEGLIGQHPLRDRPRELLMLALYRSGRDAEALRSFEEYRRLLGDELGLEPSESLRSLEDRIVTRDPSLARSAPGVRALRGYRLGPELGRSDRGVVYQAVQPAFDREVAIRVLPASVANEAEFIKGFEARTQAVARLEHPNVVPVYDYWREPDGAFLVTRYLRGGSLERTFRNGPAEVTTLRTVAAEVGDALVAAHGRGLAHGAVSRSNVLFDDDGAAYLADFGLAALGASGPPDPDRDIVDLCRVLRSVAAGGEVDDGTPVSTVRDDLPPRIAAALDDGVDGGGRRNEVLAELVHGWGGVTRPTTRIDANPYRGLEPFEEADAELFFGRRDVVDALEARLDAGDRFLALVGPSGCGKSSIVRAGLIPRLLSAAGHDWLTVTMVPGADPFDALESALLGVAAATTTDIGPRLRAGLLAGVVADVLPAGAQELLLVVDQFEELFTSDRGDSAAFLSTIAGAVADPSSRIRVVVTMRADFYDRPLGQHELGGLLSAGTVPIAALSPSQLEEAIRLPARRYGVEFDDGVVTAMVADVLDRPSALPMLQFALTELYDRRRGPDISLDDYRELGGVAEAMSHRAEDVLGAMSEADRDRARVLFSRLVAIDGDTATSRRARLVDLQALPTELDHVIRRLGEARLLAFDREASTRQPTVEVAHEALLTNWERLAEWIDEDRDAIRLQARLSAAASDWNDAGRDPAYLLAGGRLQPYRTWVESAPLPLYELERTFLAESLAAEEIASARAQRRRRWLMAAIGAVAVVTTVLSVFALFAQRDATGARFESETRRLAATAVDLADRQPQLALLLAAETYRRDSGPIGLSALQRTMLALEGRTTLGAGTEYFDAAWLSDARIAAVRRSGLDVIDLESGGITSVDLDVESPVSFGGNRSFVPFDAADGFAAVAVTGGVAVVDTTVDGLPSVDRLAHGARITGLSMDPQRVVFADDSGTVFVHALAGAEELVIDAHPEPFEDFVLPDGVTLCCGTARETISFLGVRALAIDPTGSRLATANGALVRQWDLTTGEFLGEFVAALSWVDPFVSEDERVNSAVRVNTIEYLPDDPAVLVIGSGAGALRWSAESGERIASMFHPSGRSDVSDAARQSSFVVLSDGRGFVTFPDGVAVAYPLDGFTDDETFEMAERVAFTREISLGTMFADNAESIGLGVGSVTGTDVRGDRVVVATDDGVVVVDVAQRQLLGIGREVAAYDRISMSRDGGTVLLGRRTGGDVFLDVATGEERTIPAAATFSIESLYLPDGAGDLVLRFEEPCGPVVHEGPDLLVVEEWSCDRVGEPLAASPDGRWFVSTGPVPDSGTLAVMVHDRRDRRLVTTVDTRLAFTVDFSVDSSLMAVSAPRGGTVVYETEGWTEVARLPSAVVAEFGPGGRYLAGLDLAGRVTLHDARSLEPVRELAAAVAEPDLFIRTMAFSPEDRFLLTTYGGEARLWDTSTGVAIGDPFPNDRGTSILGREGEGLHLATLVHGDLVSWNLDVDTWVDVACQAAGRNLTRGEWDQYGPDDTELRPTCPQFGVG